MAKQLVKMSKKDIKAYLFDLETVKAKMDAKISNLTSQANSLMEDAKWLDNQYATYKKAISVDVNPGEDGIEVEVEMSVQEIGNAIENILSDVDKQVISTGINMNIQLNVNVYNHMKVSLKSLADKLKTSKI